MGLARLANQLSAHRDLADPARPAEVAALWGVADVPALPGKKAVEMFQAAADGEIRALWIACTNPAQSLPDQATVRRALERCEFVVVQEAFAHTATCAYADLLLPATTWGEKDGTVTNSERRISRVRGAVPAPGAARADWSIGVDFARRLEQRLPRRRADGATLFPYENPESVWNEHRESTRGRDLDITGLNWRALEQPQQWPFPAAAVASKARLYEDGRFATPDGRALFGAPAWRAVAEPRDARFPVSLNTGRLRDQWRGMSRTGTLGRLFGHSGEPALELHPQELARRRWRAGDLVRVQSRRGEIVLPVQPSDAVAPAQAFVAMHWGEEFVSGHDASGAALRGVNALTSPALCPQSKQPEFKHAAVRLERVELPWRLVGVAWLPADTVQRARERLRGLLARFVYASCVPFGHEPQGRTGLLLRAAALAHPGDAVMQEVEAALALDAGDRLRYVDSRHGQQRTIRFAAAPGQPAAAAALEAFLLAGDVQAEPWLHALLQDGAPARHFGHALLCGLATGPRAASPARSAQVCNCFDISESAITSTLAQCHGGADDRLEQLQRRLHCGTQRGSCLPALRALVQLPNPAPTRSTESSASVA